MAAVEENGHRCNGLEQPKFILSRFWGIEGPGLVLN